VFDTTFLTPSIEYVARLMVSLVRQAFNDTIAQEQWLDQPTVVRAQRKLKSALVRLPAQTFNIYRYSVYVMISLLCVLCHTVTDKSGRSQPERKFH
jgi:hypothetical protein